LYQSINTKYLYISFSSVRANWNSFSTDSWSLRLVVRFFLVHTTGSPALNRSRQGERTGRNPLFWISYYLNYIVHHNKIEWYIMTCQNDVSPLCEFSAYLNVYGTSWTSSLLIWFGNKIRHPYSCEWIIIESIIQCRWIARIWMRWLRTA